MGAGARLVLAGGAPQLGDWDPERGLALTRQPSSSLPGFSVAGSSSSASDGAAEGGYVWTATVRLPLNKLIEAKVGNTICFCLSYLCMRTHTP